MIKSSFFLLSKAKKAIITNILFTVAGGYASLYKVNTIKRIPTIKLDNEYHKESGLNFFKETNYND